MKLPIAIVDAFATEQFKGNQAAVILLDAWLTDAQMQAIAIENNLSETAYVVRTADEKFQIRWFSPVKEIAFCGHATLASAFVIFKANPQLQSITFWADAVGDLQVNRGLNERIEMSFPNRQPEPVQHVPELLKNGLSIGFVEVLKNQQAYIVVLESEAQVRTIQPNLTLLKQLAPMDVCVTAKRDASSNAKPTYDFVSRYFWPANGGDEDPVTGSIHAALAPYWCAKLRRSELIALQASRRTGTLYCRLDGERVLIAGSAVLYLEGFLSLA